MVCLHKNTSCCIVPRTAEFSEQRHRDLPENEYVISSSSSSSWRMPIKDDCRTVFPFLPLSSYFIYVHFIYPTCRTYFPLSLSLSLSALKRFSYLNILSVFILFLHSLPSLFSPILLWLSFYLSALSSFLYFYLPNTKRYLQFRFCRCPSNGATIQRPVFPRG